VRGFPSRNEHVLAPGDEGNVVIVNTTAGGIVQKFQGHDEDVISLGKRGWVTHCVGEFGQDVVCLRRGKRCISVQCGLRR
jgi:hypothetical protein